jgi:hypothetical protein
MDIDAALHYLGLAGGVTVTYKGGGIYDMIVRYSDGSLKRSKDVDGQTIISFAQWHQGEYGQDPGGAGGGAGGAGGTGPKPPWYNADVVAYSGEWENLGKEWDEEAGEFSDSDIFSRADAYDEAFKYAKGMGLNPGATPPADTPLYFDSFEDAEEEAARRNQTNPGWFVTSQGGRNTISFKAAAKPDEPKEKVGDRPGYFATWDDAIKFTDENPGFIPTIENGFITVTRGKKTSLDDEIERLVLLGDRDSLQKAIDLDIVRDELQRPRYTLGFEEAVTIALRFATTNQEGREYFQMLVGAREEFKALMTERNRVAAEEADEAKQVSDLKEAQDLAAKKAKETGNQAVLDEQKRAATQLAADERAKAEAAQAIQQGAEAVVGDPQDLPGDVLTGEDDTDLVGDILPFDDSIGVPQDPEATLTPVPPDERVADVPPGTITEEERQARLQAEEERQASLDDAAREDQMDEILGLQVGGVPEITFNELMGKYTDISAEKKKWDKWLKDGDATFADWDEKISALNNEAQARHNSEYGSQTAAQVSQSLAAVAATGGVGVKGRLMPEHVIPVEDRADYIPPPPAKNGGSGAGLFGADTTADTPPTGLGGTASTVKVGELTSNTIDGKMAVNSQVAQVSSPTTVAEGERNPLDNPFGDTLFDIARLAETRGKQRTFVKKGKPIVRFR